MNYNRSADSWFEFFNTGTIVRIYPDTAINHLLHKDPETEEVNLYFIGKAVLDALAEHEDTATIIHATNDHPEIYAELEKQLIYGVKDIY